MKSQHVFVINNTNVNIVANMTGKQRAKIIFKIIPEYKISTTP